MKRDTFCKKRGCSHPTIPPSPLPHPTPLILYDFEKMPWLGSFGWKVIVCTTKVYLLKERGINLKNICWSSRRLEDILKTPWIHLARLLEKVFKTSWRHLGRQKIVTLKTCLEDVWRHVSKTSSRCHLEKQKVYWEYLY